MKAGSDAEALVLMGYVWRAHGIRGEVKVIPETDDPGRFEELEVVFAGRTAEAATPKTIESVRFQPSKKGTIIIVKLQGVESREDAERMRKTPLFAHPDDLPPLEEDEFFLHDLVGLSVVSEVGDEIGTVEDVMALPAQEVLVVSREDRSSAMIPAVPEFVVEIDLDAGRIVIRPIEGLLE